MLLFVEYKTSNNRVLNILSYLIIVITFLIIVVIGILYIRSTIDPPRLRVQNDYYIKNES